MSALRAFEAAARHGSFRLAAEELNVTHSAISHQVKALENDLGVAVFTRGGRSVRLNEVGRRLFPILREAFDTIADATTALRRRSQHMESLTIQVYVTVAMRWLLPRLGDFHRRFQDIPVALSTSYLDWDFDWDHADAGIIFAKKRHPELHYRPLYRGELFPVCSPRLAGSKGPLESPMDLQHYRLLSVYTAPNDWPRWFQAAGLNETSALQWMSFDTYLLALEATIAGEGIALGMTPFVDEDIVKGRLIRLFDHCVSQDASWCFVCPKENQADRRVQIFQEWLVDAVAHDPCMADGRLD